VTLETESVIIPMIGKKRVLTHTLCVSSQVGCAMGCAFCQTAQMGLVRNLTAAEIVRQWFVARHMIAGYGERPGCASIRNVVFMGMGEPMDNLDAVIDAVAVLSDHNGVGLPMSKVTISTVGRVDGIERLAGKVREPGWHRLNLAVSLNAPDDETRAAVMPINRRYAMGELRSALEAWPLYGAAKLCLEYVLIPGVNDGAGHAARLGDYVLGRGRWAGRPALPGLVNVIPYNPREGSPWPAPEEQRVDEFLSWLGAEGVYAKRRRTKGRDQMAACGQLGNLAHRRAGRVGVSVAGRAV
jgi:23S rRNA (adenine2503-C2)-methyltransferase